MFGDLTDLSMRRASLSASAELLVIILTMQRSGWNIGRDQRTFPILRQTVNWTRKPSGDKLFANKANSAFHPARVS